MLFIIFSCAVQAPPSGGPVDRVPPEIVRTDPLPGSTHISLSRKQLTIVFSERMKEGSERNNLFISPPVPFEIKWKKGRILNLHLKEPLKKQQTYVLSVGSALQDQHHNKMKQSFTLAFSTGDTIDQGEIDGRIYGLKRGETFYVFAYRLNDSLAFDPFRHKPDYVTLSGEKGNYALGYLKNGTYRVLGVEDRNHNLLLDAIVERFALSYRDVVLHDSLNRFNGLDMQLAKLDTTPPLLTGAREKFRNLLIVRFSEPLLLDRLTHFQISDSSTKQPLPIKAVTKSPENDHWVELITAPSDSGRMYRVQCMGLIDSSGNRNPDTLYAFYRGSGKKDTSAFKLLHHFPKDSAKNNAPQTAVRLQFNQPLDWGQVKQNYQLQDVAGGAVAGQWRLPNLYQGIFVPQKALKPDHVYRSVLHLQGIKSYFGQVLNDSLSSHLFSIISSKELGEISGRIQTDTLLQAPLVLTVRRIQGKRFYQRQVLRGKLDFKFNYLPEGSYKLDGFVDLNNNGKFDHGTIVPFTFCEPFAFMPDTIKVRKRWETAGLIFSIPLLPKPQK